MPTVPLKSQPHVAARIIAVSLYALGVSLLYLCQARGDPWLEEEASLAARKLR